jgi:hypothetical protein
VSRYVFFCVSLVERGDDIMPEPRVGQPRPASAMRVASSSAQLPSL